MDVYDEMYEIKDSREIDDSPTPDKKLSNLPKFTNEENVLSNSGEEEMEFFKDMHSNVEQSPGDKDRKKNNLLQAELQSDSSASISEDEKEPQKKTIEEKEFNHKLYENIDAPNELKELFQYISRYTPQRISIDHKLKIFIPEFIPAVGDIDAFLKVNPPVPVNEEKSKLLGVYIQNLGLSILDEPRGEQSDSVLLQMKLRSLFTKPLETPSAIVKTSKDIDRWISEIQLLKANQSVQSTGFFKQGVNIDNLMSEWPEAVEKTLEYTGFPPATLECALTKYIKIICNIFDIPLAQDEKQTNYITALYNLFNLFLAVKQHNTL